MRQRDENGDVLRDARLAVIRAALPYVAEKGWSADTLAHSCRMASDLDEGAHLRAFPEGAGQAVAFHERMMDEETAVRVLETVKAEAPLRERMTEAVLLRFRAAPRDVQKRNAVFLSHPLRAAAALGLRWHCVDSLWRAIGDGSSDMSFYSKRAILAGIYVAALCVWLGDDGGDEDEKMEKTRAFILRRMADVATCAKTLSAARGRLREVLNRVSAA